MLLTLFLFPCAALCTELHVYLRNADHISGKELILDDRALSVVTPHCGKVVVERPAIKGISPDTRNASKIFQLTSDSDLVYNRNGDRLSGQIVGMKDDALFVKTSFAGDQTARVELSQLDYLAFASQSKPEPAADPGEFRVIFPNGDVISGKIAGVESGQFVLDPPYSDKVRFDVSAFRSLHSRRLSKEFFPGGVAEALMNLLERSGEIRASFNYVFPALVKSFLKDGDKDGALLIFQRISSYLTDQYVFQRIGEEFLANNMFDAAVQAFEKMMESAPNYYYAYAKLFAVYAKMEKYSEAAQMYERLLSDPAINIEAFGLTPSKVRMELSDIYLKLKQFDKATEQLRRVIVSPNEPDDVRKTALANLIRILKEQGKIEALTDRYKAELAEKNKIIGEGYLELVRSYVTEGKVMKAKTYVQRLEELGLIEYAEKASQLIKD